MDWITIRKALFDFVVACTGLSDQKVMWMRQMDAPRPTRDHVMLKLYVVDDEGHPWVDVENRPLTFADKTITSVSGNVFTLVNHGLRTGDGPVWFEGADLPAPMEEETNYWIIRLSADTFSVAVQFEDTGGLDGVGNPVTPLTLSDAGSGTITVVAIDKTLRSGEEINHVQRGLVRATLQCFVAVNDDTGEDGAIATLRRIPNRYLLPTNIDILNQAGISVNRMERTRTMLGSRDATLFEPRAWLDIGLSWTFEEREVGGIIGRVDVTQEAPEPTWQDNIENEDL